MRCFCRPIPRSPYPESIVNNFSKYWRSGALNHDVVCEMKTYTRKASVTWVGTHQHGKGAITTPSAALSKSPYASGGITKRNGTNPPELIAAAHAGSFSISLANELGIAGFSPAKIDTTATVTMEAIAAGWRMTQIHLDVVASVPRVVQCDFVDAALRAKANCPVSQLVSANVSMCAKLSPGVAAARLLPHHESATVGTTMIRKTRSMRTKAKN
jgi:osmotically inducible protein OsmC